MRSKTFVMITLLALGGAAAVDAHAAKPDEHASKPHASAKASAKPAGSSSAAASAKADASAKPAAKGPSPSEILSRLKTGNEDFAKGKSTHPRQDAKRVKEVAAGQKPVVTVLSCSDSRVPVEVLFDQGIGDVFTVRVAGNVADTDELGTIEYGVDHLETPVLVVMGHTQCGAVTAVATGAEVHGHIPQLVDNIGPAVAQAKAKNPGLDAKAVVEPAITENVFQAMSDVITKSPAVRARLKEGKVKIVGAVYHLDDGSVEWLGEHPKQGELIAAGDAAPPEKHEAAGEKHEAPAGEAHKEGEAHASAEGHGGEAPHEAAEEHAAPKVPPPNPLSFAIVAAIACMAGAISMKLSTRE